MHVALRCPCGASLKAPVKYVGRELKCPKCSAMLVVPEPPVAATSGPTELEVLEPLEMPVTQSAIPKVPVARAPVSTGRPPKKEKKSSLLPYLLGVGALLIAGAGVYLFLEYQKAMPQKADLEVMDPVTGKAMTSAQLEALKDKAPPKPEPLIENSFDSKAADLSVNSENLLEDDISHVELIKMVQPSIVRIHVVDHTGEQKIGSGFFVDTEGKIFTNYHVIEGAAKVTVETKDGKKADAIGYLTANSKRDLAIIQVKPEDFECVPIAIAKVMPDNGSDIAAFGSPKGLSFSNSAGKISAIRTTDDLNAIMAQGRFSRGFESDMTWIQHSAAISGGNSGGPIVNYRGQLIGVNTWTMSEGQNLNFASSMDEIHKVFEKRDKGKMRKFTRRGTPPPQMGR